MPIQLISEMINIDEYPVVAKDHYAEPGTELVIGDLHANALKLANFIIRHGVMWLSQEDYDRFAWLYHQSENITESHLFETNTILQKAIFNNQATLKLIGDEVCDRATNVMLILMMYDELAKHQVPVETLLSNHGAEFIRSYEKNTGFAQPEAIGATFCSSMKSLRKLLQDGITSISNVMGIIERSYKPTLKLLSYTLTESNEITLYSHAGIGINNVEYIAKRLGIEYNDETPFELAQTIEKINTIFMDEYVIPNKVHELLPPIPTYTAASGLPIDPVKHPIIHLIWNREYLNLNRPSVYKGYKINFVHGHDKNDITQKNIFNLDNDLGKDISLHDHQHDIILAKKLNALISAPNSSQSHFHSSTEPHIKHKHTIDPPPPSSSKRKRTQ